MTETRISTASARVANSGALYRLLQDVPLVDDFREALTRPFFARRWQQSTERCYWIVSDGTTVRCLTLSGFDANEMVAIWISFDEYQRRAGFTLSANTLAEMIEGELGLQVEFVN